jgi:hypothetical protein
MSVIRSANDVDFQLFKLRAKNIKSSDGGQWCVEILYNGERFKIQAPQMVTTFPLTAYQHKSAKHPSYSLSLQLDEKDQDIKLFADLLREINNCAIKSAEQDLLTQEEKKTLVFNNPVRPPKDPKYPHFLRCKMVNNSQRFKFNCYVNRERIDPTIETMKDLLPARCKVNVILQLNPIWKHKKEYGISWQIKSLNIIDEHEVEFDFQRDNTTVIAPTSPLPFRRSNRIMDNEPINNNSNKEEKEEKEEREDTPMTEKNCKTPPKLTRQYSIAEEEEDTSWLEENCDFKL